ncbi:hypothetical protein KSS87_014477 [Heliosperma pusillum]|nr:hypothetical protein KSS87_008871 [Heliosperma pusillum]KAH9606162.1 hypothetical protein KSS87_014477 [Heliosperma pusillum]
MLTISPYYLFTDSSDEEMEDVPIAKENGQVGAPAAITLAAKPMVIKSLPEVNDESSEEYSSDDDDDDSSDDDADDVDTNEDGTSVSEGDEDDSDDSEEETPAKVADAGKKRPNAADAKTPPQAKKAKVATPQKIDGKKGGQPKTPAGDKTPKSGGSDASCGSCKKSFKSGTALESHNKAKHGAK